MLSFPLDGRERLPDWNAACARRPRRLRPQVIGEEWRALVRRLLHLLGYEHGAEMEAREAELL